MGNSVRLVRLLIVIIGSGWFAFIALGKEPTLDQTSNPNILDEFAIEPDGDRPTVSVDIGGRSCLFVVDTGLSMTTFDSRLRRHLSRPLDEVAVLRAGGDGPGTRFSILRSLASANLCYLRSSGSCA